jgi:hypothetical protein
MSSLTTHAYSPRVEEALGEGGDEADLDEQAEDHFERRCVCSAALLAQILRA